MNSSATLFALALAAALAGCGAPSQPGDLQQSADATAPTEPGATTQPTAPAASSDGLSATPASLAGCQPEVVTVEWDFSGRSPQPATVEILVDDGGGEPALFASGGATGSAATGLWAVPGSVFRARDSADGAEIAQIEITGPDCSSAQ